MVSWQQLLSEGISSSAELRRFLKLPEAEIPSSIEQQFKTKVPKPFAALMEPGNENDPLLLQVLAVENELESPKSYTTDPLLEKQYIEQKGILQKYHGRALLTLTGACAVHCRYCFRRHFPYQSNNPKKQGWEHVLNYLMQDQSTHEVILSGGDPLLMNDKNLADLIQGLNTIPHLKTLRIHTRIPVVLPERVTPNLLLILQQSRLNQVIVIHSNHPNELDVRVQDCCAKLKSIGCYLLNQSVLLARVNDEPKILASLSHRLFECGVLPYYLHLLDKVKGAAHFEIPDAKAFKLYQTLQSLLPGYLLPRLAREEAGKKSKTLLHP